MRRAQIFIAQDSSVLAVTEKALAGSDLVVATHWRQALELIEGNHFDLFLIGVHFSESRTVELISLIRKQKNYAKTPIIVVRCLPSSNAQPVRKVFEGLMRVGTISAYLEVEDDPDAETKIHQAVEACLQ